MPPRCGNGRFEGHSLSAGRQCPAWLPARPSCPRQTRFAGGARRRWRDPDGTICEWDYQHGTVEVYDRRGSDLGEHDPASGAQISPAVLGPWSRDDGLDL
ncbi:MAG: colicin E3/pyocin S6 family cytotoxin [Stellaceae bacterium]